MQLLRVLLSLQGLLEMLASSEELELLSLEALGKANMLPGILTGGNKAEGCRASCQLEE